MCTVLILKVEYEAKGSLVGYNLELRVKSQPCILIVVIIILSLDNQA